MIQIRSLLLIIGAFVLPSTVYANCTPQEVVVWTGVDNEEFSSADAACSAAFDADANPNLRYERAEITGVSPYQSAQCIVLKGRFIAGQGYVFDDQATEQVYTSVTQTVTTIPCNEETCNAGEQYDLSYSIDPNANLNEISNICYGGCASSIVNVIDEWEYADGTYVIAATMENSGIECTDNPPSSSSANTNRPSDANAGNPRDDSGQPCTGEYYTGPGGSTVCGSPDDPNNPDPDNTNNPDSNIDSSCISNPSSCTDTNNDGTPDTPNGCEAGQNCQDTNGDNVPDTPTGTAVNGDGSANNDGDPDTEQSSDGSGRECLPTQMT